MEMMSVFSPKLPPGFRFHPTDQELIASYLKNKISFPSHPLVSIIADIDLYKFNPWELPAKALFGESEWYFFTPRDRKYPNGVRANRAAGFGYWKATGTDKPILDPFGSQCIGVKKALVFYKGRPSKSVKTDWIMHEYRLLPNACHAQIPETSMQLDNWVLCQVRHKRNVLQQGKDYGGSLGVNPPILEDRENDNYNKLLEDEFQGSPRGRRKRAYIDEQGETYLTCHGGSSRQIITDIGPFRHIPNVSPLKDALEHIKRRLFSENVEAEFPSTQHEALDSSANNVEDKADSFWNPFC
ncbi:hypothetical protein K2173_000799 [Erythroxylum novogranatense]|uniref:NAC domain-containing protein n=1 Tax=Erythroxylum novogranatense TaxID=1862640 RepID=A0AAV8T4D3_9ROSI|nr:hypothetical protein K2173_000799 [Erythroxylum novogranatense]